MQQDIDSPTSNPPLDYGTPTRSPHRVANVVFWCCSYALGAVVLITWLRFTTLVILDYRLLQLCVLAFVVTVVLHATAHKGRFLAALIFLILFASALFFGAAHHVMQLMGVTKGGHFLLGLVVPIEIAQLVVASVGLGIALRHRLWRGGEAAA